MAPQRSPTASATIPALYRFLLLNVEPVCAFGGVLMLFFAPSVYTGTMTRRAFTSIEPASGFIYTELLGGWLHLAFTEAVVLRSVDDYRVWRLLCMGILLSDAAYVHSVAQALGGWSVWAQLGGWTVEDWTVTVSTWPFVFVRLLIVSGVGMKGKVE